MKRRVIKDRNFIVHRRDAGSSSFNLIKTFLTMEEAKDFAEQCNFALEDSGDYKKCWYGAEDWTPEKSRTPK